MATESESYKQYTPVLKGKRAEFPALENMKSYNGLYPLFEAVPTQIPQYVPKRMSAFWPQNKAYMVDMVFVDDDECDGTLDDHPLTKCFDYIDDKSQVAVPVTGTGRSPLYQKAVARIISVQKCGVAIRLISDDFEDENDLVDSLNALIKLLNVKRDEVDLIIDFESITGQSSSIVANTFRSCIDLLPNVDEWRSLISISGAFPTGISTLSRDSWNTVTRCDWLGWRQLISGSRKPSRLPSFGDYSIAHPGLPPTGRATILAQLRYTIDDVYLVWKGHNAFTHKDGFAQFYDICSSLIAKPEYCGPSFSWGDNEINERAAKRGSSGNAETWRKIATNHHMEMVMNQIANLP